ncbi:hypothetical protein N2152v2_011246 [Parachlorella kessleri]
MLPGGADVAEGSGDPRPAASWQEARFHSLQGLPVPVRELMAGGVAGGFSKTCVAPLERCKILFQTGRIQPGSVVRTLQNILQGEGLPGLFRGNGASVLRIVPYSALYMSCYERYRRLLVDVRFMATHGHNGLISPVVDLVAGSAAGATAVIFTYPLDLVRTRLAFMGESRPSAGLAASPANAAAAAAQSLSSRRHSGSSSSRGGAGFARNSQLLRSTAPPALAGGHHALSTGSLAAAPRGLTLGMSHTSAAWQPTLAAGAARTTALHAAAARRLHAAVPVAAPVSLPTLLGPHRNTIVGVLSSTFRQEGLRGVYHGIGPSLYGILPYAGLKFYVYQTLKGRFHTLWPERMRGAKSNRLPVPIMLTYGALAGLVAQTATYPLDVVRRRMQVEGLVMLQQAQTLHGGVAAAPAGKACTYAFRSTPQALLCIAQREGWRALFAGLSINYMKVVPSTAIAFTIYDYMKAHLDLPTNL